MNDALWRFLYDFCGRAEAECIPHPADSHTPDPGWLRLTSHGCQIPTDNTNMLTPLQLRVAVPMLSFSILSHRVWSRPLILTSHSELSPVKCLSFFWYLRKMTKISLWWLQSVVSIMILFCLYLMASLTKTIETYVPDVNNVFWQPRWINQSTDR